MRYTADDLLEQLRDKDVFDLTQVQFAVLEPDGQLSVLKKAQYQPITPQDLNISPSFTGLSTELIYDGIVIEQNLKQLGRSRRWLMAQLKAHNIDHPSQVFLATINVQGGLYLDKYDDQVKIVDPSDYPGPN